MCSTRRVFFLSLLALALLAAAGCNMYETDKANKLVEAAKAPIDVAVEKGDKAAKGLNDLAAGLEKMTDEGEMEHLKALAKEVIGDLEKARDGFNDAGNKFEQASKLKLQDVHKQYYDLRGKEMKKRGEMTGAVIAEPKALLESESADDYAKKLTAIMPKIQDLQKEADELKVKAEKIMADNKSMFKD